MAHLNPVRRLCMSLCAIWGPVIQFPNSELQAHTFSRAQQLRKFIYTSFNDITNEDSEREKALLEVNDNLNLHFYRFFFSMQSQQTSRLFSFLFGKDGALCLTMEKGMATHSSILAWRIPWREEPGGLQSMRSQRIRHD